MDSVGICSYRVNEKESDSGVCACKRVGKEVSKANDGPFSDGGEWKVCREFVEWNYFDFESLGSLVRVNGAFRCVSRSVQSTYNLTHRINMITDCMPSPALQVRENGV